MSLYSIRIKSTNFQYGIAIIIFCSPALFIPKNSFDYWTYMFLGVSLLGFGLWVGSKLTKGIAQIELTDKTFEIKWKKRAIFSTLENTKLELEDINGWKYRKESSYDYFILYNTKGQDLIFYRDSIWNPDKDDFAIFLKDFRGKVKNYNSQEASKNVTNTSEIEPKKLIIDKEASFHNSTKGRLVFYVYLVTLIFGIYSLITKWDELDYRRVFLIGLLAMCVGLIFDHLNKRKKNSS
tara:strand:+ start:596 stop:1306 length:711 start_codon:yes stop_codon:yes gene_type:complete